MSVRRIFLRQDTSTNWVSNNPVLNAGELGYDSTNNYLKCGDGTTPWNSLGQLYDIAGITANATAISAHSTRLTNLETYSPLGSGTGTVTGITWRNLTELALAGEKITNGTLNSTGGATAWSPTDLSNLETWLDASDTSSSSISEATTSGRVSTWHDKSGNQKDYSTGGGSSWNLSMDTTQPYTNARTINSLNVLDFRGTEFLRGNNSLNLQNFSIFMVGEFDSCSTFSAAFGFSNYSSTRADFSANSTSNFQGLITRDFANNHTFLNSTTAIPLSTPYLMNLDVDRTNDSIEFFKYGTSYGTTTHYTANGLNLNNRLVLYNYRQVQINDSTSSFGFRNSGGMDGAIGEVIITNTPISTSDRQKIEGYLAHKWGLASNLPSNHPYLSNAPTISTILTQGWSVQSGSWGSTDQTNGVLSGAVTIRQNVNLGSGGVYDVTVDRTDTNSSLTSKVKTSHAVTWLSHANAVATEADVAHDGTARFEVTGTVPTYIELDTIDTSRIITSVSMTQSVLAGGTVQAGNNGTLEKIAGTDAWNAGASSTEYIGGQNEGYVQFQIGQTGKDLKTGLTYADVDYGDADPFEMTFSGTDVSIGGSVRTTYISGDWFRIRHDSANNQIVYQKRQTTANGLEYVTFYTDPTTTNGSNLYFDTSFYHLNGRINDVTMVV